MQNAIFFIRTEDNATSKDQDNQDSIRSNKLAELKSKISEINSKSYPTIISLDQFRNSTGCDSFPEYLQPDIRKGKLHCYSNGSISARIDSVEMTFDVRWDFFPSKGGGDSFQATYYGDNGKLEVVQDKSTGFVKELYKYFRCS